MAKPATQSCIITYSISGGTVAVIGTIVPASSKVSSGGNAIHHDKITINVMSGTSVVMAEIPAGAASGTGVLSVPGIITIDATTQKTTTGGKGMVCEGDSGKSTFVFLFPAASGTGTVSGDVEITAKVSSAGQNVVNAT